MTIKVTPRTIVVFDHNDDFQEIELSVNRLTKTFAAESIPLRLHPLVRTDKAEFFRPFRISIIPGPPDRIRKEFQGRAKSYELERVVQVPNLEAVHTDDPTDLYNHLKYLGVYTSAYDGAGVKVAILDTGVFPHDDIYSRIVAEKSFVDGRTTRDDNGHGTHCAGLIVGPRGTSGERGYGLAPKANLCVARVLNSDGVGIDGDILCGLEWAFREQKARVFALCLGAAVLTDGTPSSAYEEVAKQIRDAGGVVIAAAGNRNPDSDDHVNHPASCDSILAAGAMDRKLRPSKFSYVDKLGDPVELREPGVGIRSSWRDGFYRRMSGTSTSAALAAGVAALYAEKYPLPPPPQPIPDLFKIVKDAQGDKKVLKAP